MGTLIRVLSGLTRLVGIVLVAVVVIAIGLVLAIGFAPGVTRFAVDEVAKLASTPDRRITVTDPSGLLTGKLRAGNVTLSDTKGIFGQISGLSVDWSPLALIKGTFHAETIAADKVDFVRLPVSTAEVVPEPTQATRTAFTLPVAVTVDAFNLPNIQLSKQIAGNDFALAASGSLDADGNRMAMKLNANRLDVPDARLVADVVFAPDDNQLKLQANLAEPKGGMLAGLLRLPGSPAMNIDLSGQGPLSDWTGKLQAALDGQQMATIDGRHVLSADGVRHITVKGGGKVDSLLPPNFRPLFAGQTTIDVAAAFDGKGKIDIQTGNLATGSVVLAASGTLDPAGNNSLNANLIGTSGPVDFRWPLAEGEARALISRVDLALTGAAGSAKIDARAQIDSASVPQGRLAKVDLTAKSDDFNVSASSGPLLLNLSVGDASFVNPDLQRAVHGPLSLSAPLQLSSNNIGFNGTTLKSGGINGTLNGRYTLTSQSLNGNFKLAVAPAALPEAVAQKFDAPISLEAQVAGTIPSKINLSNLHLKSGTAEINGNIALADEALTADLSGRLLKLSKLLDTADGQADFTVKASGPLAKLGVDASLKAINVKLAGRLLDTLDVAVKGVADPNAPEGSVTASGAIDGKPINISANATSKDGATDIPGLSVEIGDNSLNGWLTLSPGFEPAGSLTFDFPDIGLLAALAGQRAEGNLRGEVKIDNDNGKTSAVINASGSGVRRDDLSIVKPEIGLTISDLKAFAANGSIRAGEIASGTNRLVAPALTFKQQGNRTDFDLKANYDDKPVTASGNVVTGNGQTVVSLDNFAATPMAIPVKLGAPTKATIANGTVTLSGLTIQTGSGSINVTGSAGEALDIEAKITSLPASLANTFMASLAAEGTISGTAKVTGKPASPNVVFQADWANAATSQTKSAGISALGIKTNGKFADNKVTIDLNLSGPSGLSLNGGGSVEVAGSKALALKFEGTVPFDVLAGQLSAQGYVASGAAKVNVQIGGTTAAPAITGSVNVSGAKLLDIRRNLAVNAISANLTLEGPQARLVSLNATLGSGGTVSASGTVGISGDFPADIAIKLNRATYVDGTLVTATVDGTLGIKGPILTAPVLSGRLRLEKASITVPEKLPASLSEINIRHKNAPTAVTAQFKKDRAEGATQKSMSLGLDLQLDAPSQIFVRGRGIDAELGGSVIIKGTAATPVVTGGFTMRRGRLTILSRRLDFTDKSRISFAGDLTPTLDMEATSTASSTTVTVNVSGVATDPTIGFSSSPALPQDEVMAQLIFGQSMAKLSPVQIAQLADAASQLAGGRSTSLFEGLRNQLGVDDLDVTTDSKGQTQVGVGRYINKRTYLELQQGTGNSTKAVINLDVGRGIKLQGSAGSNGAGGAGVVYEHEYD
ncbi:translocation/assembly module TamB domain-containing protein [Rhizobium tumorigenes]|uniref:Translocation/assembly module TamB n=1 Tax=Rhizobium tumorigenes TaxID=2041385 RepID=A0AAF1K3U4_9HYPH|nr:translocation/assembly module TamB domain-containing protein [Rhizobium tumorigenes]WFR94940.1 translocation/assembly module TamB [Rhizobium tumorigenes]